MVDYFLTYVCLSTIPYPKPLGPFMFQISDFGVRGTYEGNIQHMQCATLTFVGVFEPALHSQMY